MEENKEYISLEEFSSECGITERTIKKNINDIPGAVLINNIYMVENNSRYPYYLRFKADNKNKKRLAILKSLYNYRYLSKDLISLNENDFNELLDELVKADLIKRNNSTNTYGTNGYSITDEGVDFLNNHKRSNIDAKASALGTFVGAAMKKHYSGVEYK